MATQAIRSEIQLRRSFVLERLGRRAARSELKDLVDFMHGFPAPLARCSECGVLVRGEQRVPEAHAYEDDPNDLDLMAHVFPLYIEAFRRKADVYRPLLNPHADVLEIGSHLGAFLQVAEEWSWNAAALDVGNDTVQFARGRGFRVDRNVIEEASFSSGRFEAVFVWNCFEQIPDPGEMLRTIHHVLKRHGLLVIRVPNSLFYSVISRVLHEREHESFVVDALAYNNLLGFPYLYGYTAEALNRLASNHGFEPVSGANSELVTMPFADMSRRIVREQVVISQAVSAWSAAAAAASGRLAGPWIEMVFRKVEEPERKARHSPLRLPRRKIDSRFLERAA
jgi:SAM-dependent methyltransferase